MSVLSDVDRDIVARAIARSRGVLSERVDPVGGESAGRGCSVEGDYRSSGSWPRLVSPLAEQFTGLCIYCGAPTIHAIACEGHADLPDLDPYLMPATTQRIGGTRC